MQNVLQFVSTDNQPKMDYLDHVLYLLYWIHNKEDDKEITLTRQQVVQLMSCMMLGINPFVVDNISFLFWQNNV